MRLFKLFDYFKLMKQNWALKHENISTHLDLIQTESQLLFEREATKAFLLHLGQYDIFLNLLELKTNEHIKMLEFAINDEMNPNTFEAKKKADSFCQSLIDKKVKDYSKCSECNQLFESSIEFLFHVYNDPNGKTIHRSIQETKDDIKKNYGNFFNF